MYRGTTPTLNFNFEFNLDEVDITEFYITFSQRNQIVFEKTLEDLEISENKATVQLTQQDTLKLMGSAVVYIQARFKIGEDQVYATNVITTSANAILKDGEL